jgi:hypothetical protein
MRVKIFDYKNSKISLNTPELELIQEFKVLFTKSNPHPPLQYFTFIYLFVDPRSPYAGFSEDERREKALIDSELKSIEPELETACEFYHKICYSTPVLRMIKKMERGMEQLEKYFDIVNFEQLVESGARKGTPLYDPKELINVMKQADFIIDQIKKLETRALDELVESSSVRGDRAIGYDEEQYL